MNLEGAHSLFEEWYPDSSVRTVLAGLVAQSIRRAHSQAPSSWEFTLRPGYARLNIGQVAVLDLGPHGLTIYSLATETPSSEGIERQEDWSSYAAVPGEHELWYVTAESVALLPASILNGHFGLVDAALRAKRVTPHKAAHTAAGVEALARLSGIALEHPAYHVGDALTSDAASDAAGLFGDSVQNALVERAAVRIATHHYESRGWTVITCEMDCCGYDLECRRGDRVRHVEVKGRSSEEREFALTAGELRVAENDVMFELALVTNALSETPALQVFNRKTFLADFAFSPLQYKARYSPTRSDS